MTPLGHLATRVKLRAQEGASLPHLEGLASTPGLKAQSRSRLPAPKSLTKESSASYPFKEKQACPCPYPQGLMGRLALAIISLILPPYPSL